MPALDPVWRVVDAATGYLPMGVVAGLLVMVLAARRSWREALLTAVSFAGAVAGTTLLKALVERPRPSGLPAWAEVSTYSFPSGHATATAALAMCTVLVVQRPGWIVAAAAAFVGVAGWAQLAAGLHHPGDVAAGWLWAAAWTTAVWSAAGRLRVNRH